MIRKINRFDIVRILSVDRVAWLAGPQSRTATPHGDWSVVLVNELNNTLLIAKDETIVMIPGDDVALVAAFDNNQAIQAIADVKIEDLDKFDKEMQDGDTEERTDTFQEGK